MRIGEKATILSDAENAYGPGGFPKWGILPNSTLRFEVEVLAASRWIAAPAYAMIALLALRQRSPFPLRSAIPMP